MRPGVAPRRLALGVLVGVAAGALVWLAWYALRSPHSRFLPPDPSAEWIDYPVPPSVSTVVTRVEERCVFRRTFELTGVPAWARLRVRGSQSCTITLNGRPVDLSAAEHWNQVRAAEVAEQLHAGTNYIRAIVANDVGPPALWLVLEGPGWSVASDDQWSVSLDGATECSSHRVTDPLPVRHGNAAEGGNQTLAAFRACLPALGLFALLSAGILLVAHFAARRKTILKFFGYELSPLGAGLLAAILLWLALFAHNALQTPLYSCGFDAPYHVEYVQYIQEHKSLPLADEGWEMHHPPLFYWLARCLLRIGRLSALDPGAVAVFRLMGLAAGVAQLVLVAGCMQRVFPGQPRRQLVGLALAAFLPAQIYTCHYVTNESLLITLGTAALYLCLRAVRDDPPSLARHALLGLCLGAALLTKVTALVVVGVVLLVLGGQLLVRRERRFAVWARGVGVTVLVTCVVSGWHYARVWAHFGTPLVGNFDVASGFWFGQPPGYATLAGIFHFGRALVDPFFSALTSLPDGLYSTLWGDGLCGGVGAWAHRPPWNYDLMAAGYLLALLPSVAILVGLFRALVGLVRRPQAEWFLLVGVAGGLIVALLYQYLRYPYYGHARASYLLIGMAPMCAFCALGLDALARPSRFVGVALALLLGTWAWTAYTSFWIDSAAPATHNWGGEQLLRMTRTGAAVTSFRKAIDADRHFLPAQLNLVRVLLLVDQVAAARSLIGESRRSNPNDPDVLILHAFVNHAGGRRDEALDDLRRASALAPDHPIVYSHLGGVLMEENRPDEAIAAYREALRVGPRSPVDHANLGLLLARTGKMDEAIAQYRWAVAVRPNEPEWLADLAWILATSDEARDPTEALRLAEEACKLTESRDAACLQALAAAQAAGGRYGDAVTTAKRAAQVAASNGQTALAKGIREQMEKYETQSPVSARGPLRRTPYAESTTDR
jgi:tetratricopeptide (TPR) repeat protein